MKLKNKKTGEIVEVITGDTFEVGGVQLRSLRRDPQIVRCYNSLAELNDEWEDMPEEPKEHWYINEFGTPTKADSVGRETLYDKCRKNFGNYFETEEEAEKAVEKLKCFTNLKNHEFMFDGWYYGTDGNIVILANAHKFNDMEEQDLTKVFGEKICVV